MSYTCRACGEQATLTVCEHCGGQGRSQSAIAEVARLRAELDTVERERGTTKADFIRAIVTSKAYAEKQERGYEALLAARDAAIVELRAALEFYGNRGNHCIQRIGNLYQGPMIDDAGIKARAALANAERLAEGAKP